MSQNDNVKPPSKEGFEFNTNWSDLRKSPKTIFLSLVVVFVVYGMLYMMNTSWFWALLLALFSGWLFWYLCEKCVDSIK